MSISKNLIDVLAGITRSSGPLIVGAMLSAIFCGLMVIGSILNSMAHSLRLLAGG